MVIPKFGLIVLILQSDFLRFAILQSGFLRFILLQCGFLRFAIQNFSLKFVHFGFNFPLN